MKNQIKPQNKQMKPQKNSLHAAGGTTKPIWKLKGWLGPKPGPYQILTNIGGNCSYKPPAAF